MSPRLKGRRLWGRLLFLTVGGLQGCFAPVDTSGRAALLSPSPLHRDEHALTFSTRGWPKPDWWQNFGDSQLNGLIEKGLQQSPSLAAALANVTKAYELAKAQRGILFPQLSLDPTYSWNRLSKDGFFRSTDSSLPAAYALIDLVVQFTFNFDLWGKNRHAFLELLGKAQAQEAEFFQTKLLLSTSIASLYFDLMANKKRLLLYEKITRLDQTFEGLKHGRYGNGVDPLLPDLAARETVVADQSMIAALQKTIFLDEHLLNALTGQLPDAPLDLKVSDLPMPEQISLPANLPLNLVARRADLMAQIFLVEAAAHRIGVAKAGFYPDLNLTGLVGLESRWLKSLFEPGNTVATVSPALNLPLYTGGQLTATLSAAEAAYDAAVYTYNDMLLNALRQVVDQLTSLQTAQQRVLLQTKAIALADQNRKLVHSLFKRGVENRLAFLQAKRAYLFQCLQKLPLEEARLQASIELIKALGGGYEAEVGSCG